MGMKARGIAAIGVWTILALGPASLASAQESERIGSETRARAPQTPTELDQQRAEVTREELRELLRRYPPALGRILRLDPTLLTNNAYIAPYPALATYLQRHPEVARYPDYFLEFVNYYPDVFREPQTPEVAMRRETMNAWRDTFMSVMVFGGFLTTIFTVGWLIRYIVGHRRWLRTVKIQTDVHGRLLERFSSNEDLMAYIQSPAGRQYLQGLPAAAEPASAPAAGAAPLIRILWSVQAGVVLACGSIGLLFIKRYMVDEVADMLLVWGVLGLSVGVGFIVAAAASYILSLRLGLLDAPPNGGTKAV